MTPEEIEAKRNSLQERVEKMDPRLKCANLFRGLMEDALHDPEVSLDEFLAIAARAYKHRQFLPGESTDNDLIQPSLPGL